MHTTHSPAAAASVTSSAFPRLTSTSRPARAEGHAHAVLVPPQAEGQVQRRAVLGQTHARPQLHGWANLDGAAQPRPGAQPQFALLPGDLALRLVILPAVRKE